MIVKQNCWEFNKCGREPKGSKVAELGICPATTYTSVNGLNGGKNGGRICWAVAGTYAGEFRGNCSMDIISCTTCDFFEMVEKEESAHFVLLKPGQIFYH